ncbi:MAG: DUF4129 domain-containing protein [Terriglobales bacterium]|jgi:hypothetical protein
MTIGLRAATLLAILGFAGFAAGGETPLSLAEYKSRLEQYSAQIHKVAQHPEYAVDFHRDVPSAFQVQTQSGVFTVSMEFLHKGLETFLKSAPSSKPTILSRLDGRINAMGAEAGSFEQARGGDPVTRERLTRILSAREFGRVRGPTELELLEQRIRDWINKKLDKLFPSAPDLDQLGQIFVWIVIAIVSSILAVWLYRQSRERMLDTPKEITPFVPSAKSWRTWLAEAREKANSSEWRDAIHLGFWAAVSRMESDGVWPPDKARTPREYLRAIPSSSENKPSFAAVTKTFEAAWYGGRPASADDFERFLSELEKLGCRG